jgi:uncharacterized protein YndB with AHSA1/START domain
VQTSSAPTNAAPTAQVPDVRKTVVVDVPLEQAYTIFVERPYEWWPAHHVFVQDRQAITIEPRAGGRYYERGADGSTVDWGTVVEWDPPRRVVLTWRMGPGWRPVLDDDLASLIEVDLVALGPSRTEVALTHARLDKHGDAAPGIRAALDGPSPGATLEQYAAVVARHAGARS